MIPEKTTFNQDNIIKGQRQTSPFFLENSLHFNHTG